MTTMDTARDELQEWFNERMAAIAEANRPPRFRYFQKRNGPMFSWTTEKFQGRYASFVHVPEGQDWFWLDEDSISSHKLRKDAKARALKLYNAWLEGDSHPW